MPGDGAAVPLLLEGAGATGRLAARLARDARPGDVIALDGPLGAGKTTFARAFVAALGGGEDVPSPTFPLVHCHPTPRGEVWHFDLHRLERPGDVWELGLEEALAGGISLVEWPDRIEGLLPEGRLTVRLEHEGPDARRATLAPGPGWEKRLAATGTDDG